MSFQVSKVKEVISQDPDVKEITKPAVELVARCTEEFVSFLFSAIFDETKKRRKVTAEMRDFVAAVKNDPALSAMLGQFLVE